jgi:hypothetical protein
METRGSLTNEKLEEIFHDLSQNSFTGTLATYDEKAWKEFYFASTGIRITSVGAKKALPVGEILVRLGLLGEDDLIAGLQRMKERSGLFGDILLEMRLVDEEDLDRGLRTQAQFELFDLFFWRRPTFEYQPGMQSVASPVVERHRRESGTRSLSMQYHVHDLIKKARGLQTEVSEMKRRLPHSAAAYRLTKMGREKIFTSGTFTTLGALEQRVVILIDGQNSLQDLFQKARVLWIDVMRVIDRLSRHKAVEVVRAKGK